jgi:ABC-2 type transport system permease protein
MTNLLSSELFRMRRRLMARVMLLAMAAVIAGAYLVQSASDPSSDAGANLQDLRLADAPDLGLQMVFQIGLVTSVVLAASSIATEYGWGTIRSVLARVDHRSSYLTAKLISAVLFAAVMVVVGSAVAFGASAAVTSWRDLDGGAGPDAASRFLMGPVRIFIATLPYLSMAFLVALWSRTTAAGFGAVIAAYYLDILLGPLFEPGNPLSWVPENALIWRNVSALLEANSLTPNAGLPEPSIAALVLLGYTAVFTLLAYWRFSTRDVLSGS